MAWSSSKIHKRPLAGDAAWQARKEMSVATPSRNILGHIPLIQQRPLAMCLVPISGKKDPNPMFGKREGLRERDWNIGI